MKLKRLWILIQVNIFIYFILLLFFFIFAFVALGASIILTEIFDVLSQAIRAII